MADTGWPFYGLDFIVQPDISAAGYFDQLAAMVGIDLMDLYAAVQLSGILSGGDGNETAVIPVSDALADAGRSDSVPSGRFEPDGAAFDSGVLPGVGGDDGSGSGGKASADGIGLWLDMLGAAVDSGDGGFGWGFDGLGVTGDGGDDGQTAYDSFAQYPGADGWRQQLLDVSAGMPLNPEIPFARAFSGLEAAAGGSGVSLGEALDAAVAGMLWQKAASFDSFAAFAGSASHSPTAAQMSIPRMDGITGASLPDAPIPPEMLWSETEDRLLDRLERRLGIEIANSTEGAFG